MKLGSLLVGCSVGLAAAATAAADPWNETQPVDSATYEFTGTGQFCPLDRASGAAECTQGVEYTGIVTITVLEPFPSGPGAFMGDRVAGDPFGWVESDFVISWEVAFGPGEASPRGMGKITDVNDDGFRDVVLRFQGRAAGIGCGSNAALLTGRTFDGEEFVGADSVHVNCG
jgi:hypothetical protein